MRHSEHFSTLVFIALCLYLYFTFILYSSTSSRKASGYAIVLGILFLPIFDYKLPHIPPFNKPVFIGCVTLLFSFLYDRKNWINFRPKWFDYPIIFWCLSPSLSSLSNDLGLKDGVFASLARAMLWATPYFIGRIYFSEARQSRNLALGIFVGGILYIPFCLYEIRFSPQLHKMVYGYYQHDFLQTIRFDGFRPMVFMQHGLMVGMWMTSSCLMGFWLWKFNCFRKNEAKLAKVLLLTLFITTFMIKSSGALILLLVGILVITFDSYKLLKYTLLSLVLIPLIYVPARTSGYWTGKTAVDLAANFLGPDRAYSLAFRLDNEEMMIRKTMERPFLGWGGWGRGRVYDEDGNDISVTDSLWIIAFTENGFWGTFWLYISLILPATLYVSKRIRNLKFVFSAPMSALVIITLLYTFDTLLNNMPNPVYFVVIGSLNGQIYELETISMKTTPVDLKALAPTVLTG